jgi:hypothetical protein
VAGGDKAGARDREAGAATIDRRSDKIKASSCRSVSLRKSVSARSCASGLARNSVAERVR